MTYRYKYPGIDLAAAFVSSAAYATQEFAVDEDSAQFTRASLSLSLSWINGDDRSDESAEIILGCANKFAEFANTYLHEEGRGGFTQAVIDAVPAEAHGPGVAEIYVESAPDLRELIANNLSQRLH